MAVDSVLLLYVLVGVEWPECRRLGLGFSFCGSCVEFVERQLVEIGVGFVAWGVEGGPVGGVEGALAFGGIGEESLEGRDGGGVDDVLREEVVDGDEAEERAGGEFRVNGLAE